MDDATSNLYVPAAGLEDPVAIESEIVFLEALMDSIDPPDMNPDHDRQRRHYEAHVDALTDRLVRGFANSGEQLVDGNANSTEQLVNGYSSAALTPGSATDWSDVSRKRPRELSLSDHSNSNSNSEFQQNSGPASPGTPLSLDQMPGAWPSSKRPRPSMNQQPVVDLTQDQPRPYSHSPYPWNGLPQPQNPYATPDDPFAELVHARQPVQVPGHVEDSFGPNQPMNLDELAQWMSTPTVVQPNQLYYPPQQPQPRPRPPLLNVQLPGYGINAGLQDWHAPKMLPSLPSPTLGDRDVVDSIIESIKCQDDEGMPREQTPKEMSCVLMEHQKQALAWLLTMERGQNKGSILADEMGLGKTIEGLALIVANPSKNAARKTTLIVAPVALMRQWEKEIERHVKPAYRLRVYTYHGGGKKADWNRLREYDVVLTTYGTLAHEQKRLDTRKESEAVDRERREPAYTRKASDRMGLLDPQCYWYRVVLDEAQCIKNRGTLTSKAASALVSEHRLCMTGTPMQNSVEELYPLIRFLHITAYQSWPRFNDDIAKPMRNMDDDVRSRGMGRLQALIKSVTLRREKTTIVDGRPVVDLPPKHTNIRPVEFSHAEREVYKAVETKSQIRLNRYLKKGTVSNNYANILVMLLRLRQICCHPHLIQDLGVQVSTEGIAEDELRSRAESLSEDAVRRLKDVDGDGFECPICYETELNPTIFTPCGHTCCGECFQKLVDPGRHQEGNEETAPRCPHCRGALSSERITDYRHFCRVFCPEKYEELRRALTDGADEDESEDDGDDSSDDDDDIDANDRSLGGFIVDDDVEDDVRSDANDDIVDDDDASISNPRSSKKKGKQKAKQKQRHTLAELKKLSLRSAPAKARYLRRLAKQFKSSAKLDETMELLATIRANDATEKTLIFSSFTTLLDLLEVPLRDRGYRYQRYDGSMRFDDRVEAVNTFMDSASENILLISIKAGNAGLNLAKASQVIMLDPFWNPFVEDQAVDRAHRMPQRRPVHVHRVLVPDTVEDRICKLQDAKRETIEAALDERVGRSLTKLSVGELRNLFGM